MKRECALPRIQAHRKQRPLEGVLLPSALTRDKWSERVVQGLTLMRAAHALGVPQSVPDGRFAQPSQFRVHALPTKKEARLFSDSFGTCLTLRFTWDSG